MASADKRWAVRAILQDIGQELSDDMLFSIDGSMLVIERPSTCVVAGDDGGLLRAVIPVDKVVFFAKSPPDEVVASLPSLLVQCEPDSIRIVAASSSPPPSLVDFFRPTSVGQSSAGLRGMKEGQHASDDDDAPACISLRLVPVVSRSEPPPVAVHEMWEACCAASIAVDEGESGAGGGDDEEGCSRLLQVLRSSAQAPPVGFKRTRD